MTSYESYRPVPLGATAILRVVSIFEHAYDRFVAKHVARKTRAALAALTDRQLADIGLHRNDISAVALDLARR